MSFYYKFRRLVNYSVMFLLLLSETGCKKLVDVSPPVTSITQASVYNSDATATAVLTGIYSNMSLSIFGTGGLTSMSLLPSLTADELVLYGSGGSAYSGYYSNSLTNSSTAGADFWSNIYPVIYVTNSAIAGLESTAGLTPAIKQQLLGEAKFMRAFCYFYLVNLYGDVPLVTGTDYTKTAVLSRTPGDVVYQQVIEDLKGARSLLSPSFLDASLLSPTAERVRPTQWAANALLARAYLYSEAWDSAEAAASSVINNSGLFGFTSLDSTFLKNAPDAIWQLQPVQNGANTQDAFLFVLPSTGPNSYNTFYLSPFLLSGFEPGDQRKIHWVDSVIVDTTTYYYPYKYKVNTNPELVTEYTMVLRLAEQYLIRAEARAQQMNLAGAASDLNVIRSIAGLSPLFPGTQTDMLNAIYHERQVELFTEWGHRWLDLKRTGQVNTIMPSVCTQKGGMWSSNWELYPILLSELKLDPFLTQNNGY